MVESIHQRNKKIARRTTIKVCAVFLPVVFWVLKWTSIGSIPPALNIVIGLMLAAMAAFAAWQIYEIGQLAQREAMLVVEIEDAHTSLCDTCPYYVLATASQFFPADAIRVRYKKGDGERDHDQQSLSPPLSSP